MKKKLAIVGTAPSSLHLAPYNDPDYEIWGLNGVYGYIDVPNISNITRWFDIHFLAGIKGLPNNYFDFHKTCPVPVYMQDVFEEVPNSVKFPLDEVLTRFPRRYFTNTVSWMLALAICEGYEDISVYGVDMSQGTEYASQRPSCEYFLGYAEGMGINIYLPQESDLLKTPFLYGFEDEKQDFMRSKLLAKKAEYEAKKAEYQRQIEQATAALNTYDGALQDVEYTLGVWL
jgi:hypothetical protein